MEETRSLGRVRVMATRTIRVFHLDSPVRLDRFFIGDVMTHRAQVWGGGSQKALLFGLVGLMAERTLPLCGRGMKSCARFFHEFGEPGVTGEAKLFGFAF